LRHSVDELPVTYLGLKFKINQMIFDGEPSIGMPRQEYVSVTLTFEPMTLKT